MRSFVVGLVLGCFFLQTRSMLPEQPAWATVVLSLLMALSALGFVAGRPAGRASDKSRHRWTTFALASSAWMISGALLGVGYAQYRAETRLADALSREWEGRDIELVGAVVSLPTLTERGTRFMFEVDASSVKAARVPRNISLTWYIEQPRNGEVAKPPPTLSPDGHSRCAYAVHTARQTHMGLTLKRGRLSATSVQPGMCESRASTKSN
jgi:competence protein ComEC